MNAAWRIQPGASLAEDAIVFLESPDRILRGRVETRHPQRGLHDVSLGDRPLSDWQLLASQLAAPHDPPLSLTDCYVRGADLIVIYAEEREKLRREIYWRALVLAASAACGVELIVSVQTSLLHSQPQLEISSRLSPGRIAQMTADDHFEFFDAAPAGIECTSNDGAGVFLFQPDAADFSYVEMVHPSDFQHATLSLSASEGTITHLLFPESLEKGVIRRGRVRGWFIPRDGDLSAAATLYRSWLSEPPPLTT